MKMKETLIISCLLFHVKEDKIWILNWKKEYYENNI
jgi:hypothetical protein